MSRQKWFKNTVMVNRDPNWYGGIDDSSAEACRESMVRQFSAYSGKITDISIGVLEQTAMIPSNSLMWRGEKYLQKKENGHNVDYSGNIPLRALYRCFAEYKVDAVQIFIDQVKKKGIRPWLALRMNDCHFGGEPTSFLHTDMYYEELDAGHMVGDPYGYYKYCYDFTYPRIKEAINGYITELLDRYDVFGLELDFMRECHCFDYMDNPDCHKIMTEYIRSVKRIVSDAEKRVGHDIKISIRTCSRPENALAFGFDIKTLCDEGLIDIVIPTPRWMPTESYIPIAKWRELLGDDIGILGGIEAFNLNWTFTSASNSKAYAAAFMAQGADGIYFNNHENPFPRNLEAWEIGFDNCLVGHREFVVLGSDCIAYPKYGYSPLPLILDGEGKLPLIVGKVKADDKVKLIADFIGEELPSVSINDIGTIKAQKREPYYQTPIREKDTGMVTLNTPIEFDISGITTESELELVFRGNGSINYLNVVIDAE